MSLASIRSLVLLAMAFTLFANTADASPAPPPSLGSTITYSSKNLRIRSTVNSSTRHRAKHTLGNSLSSSHHQNSALSNSSGESKRLLIRAPTANPIKSLQPSYNRTISGSKQLSANAAVASTQANDLGFQQQSSGAASEFQSGLSAFQGLLGQFAANKGLENYDSGDKLETMLKNIVNATKNSLSAISILTYRIPILNSVLGPIVYDVKCIIDDLLDLTENLTDSVLNDLAPLLRGLDNQAVDLLCGPLLGVPILGTTMTVLCPQT